MVPIASSGIWAAAAALISPYFEQHHLFSLQRSIAQMRHAN